MIFYWNKDAPTQINASCLYSLYDVLKVCVWRRLRAVSYFSFETGRMWTRARGERRSPSEEKIRDCDGIFGLAICRYSRLFIDSPSHIEPWYHFAAISRVYFCKQTCLYGRPLLFCSGAFLFLPLTVRYWNDGFVINLWTIFKMSFQWFKI